MELAELFMELLAELKAWAKIRQLKVQVEIQQLEELKVFNSLKLSVVVLTEVLVELTSEIKLAQTEFIWTEFMQTKLVWTKLMRTKLTRIKLIQTKLVV